MPVWSSGRFPLPALEVDCGILNATRKRRISALSHTVYLALGTNLGDKQTNLRAARRALSPAVTLRACSPIYRTPPWGYTNQADFLNQVVCGDTQLAPLDLLAFLKTMEHNLGRMPTFRYGPRVIDVDILFYDDLVLQSGPLSIPHPRLHERAFVLVPLADLAPDLRHPALGLTVRALLAAVDTRGVERLDLPPAEADSQ